MGSPTATALQPLAEPIRGIAPEPGSFGLTGIWRTIGNLSAMGVLLLVFYQDRHAALDSAREDRQLFREAVGQLHIDNEAKRQTIAELADVVRSDQRAVTSLAKAVKELAEEVRRIKERTAGDP